MAFIIAVATHALILGIVSKRFPSHRFKIDQERPVTMTFTYREPVKKIAKQLPPHPVAKPPDQTRVPKTERLKPKKQPVKKPVVKAKPPPEPIIQPHAEPLTPDPEPEPEALPTAVPSEAPPKATVEEAVETVDIQTEAQPVIGPLLRKARPLYRLNPPPRYPRSARRRGYEGRVILEAQVLKDGTVGNLRVVKSSGHSILDIAALKAARNWLFEPGTLGDQKVDTWVRVPIRFKIE
jgi:protein TonB